MARIIDLRKKSAPVAPVEIMSVPGPVASPTAQSKRTSEQRPEDDNVFMWETPAEPTRKRSSVVVWILLFVLFIGAFVFQRNILAALLGVIAAVVFVLQGRRDVKGISVVVDETGLVIGNRTHGFHALKSFWITAVPGGPRELSLEFKARLLPYMKIPIGRQDPVPLRIFLSAYLPEREHEPSLIDELMRSVGY